MTAIEKLIATAKSQVGYLEKASNSQLDDFTANAGYNNWTKYARDLCALDAYNGNKNGYAWCDMFVDWCFYTTFGLDNMVKMLYQPLGGAGAGCTYSARYFKNNGKFYTSNPKPGDQIFFTKDNGSSSNHTGLVVAVDNERVYTIEGNTSATEGVVANGGCVASKSYSLWYSPIMGYGRPDFSIVEMEDEDMTIDKFKELWNEMRTELKDNDSQSWSKDAREWAVSSGLINGNGTTVGGEDNMMWEDLLTREQLVTVLYRFSQMMGK